MHIRTDDEVYRVDAVWLGPPRATFPWRARYSAYGVGLLVMLAVMFVQRRLGIPLGFFSIAWALLITVGITRFVSRRINDERPLLEWLTLFFHELRGPRAKSRVVGGALTTDHVAVRRDRPKLTGAPTAIALPRGSDPAPPRQVAPAEGVWGPPPRDDEPVAPPEPPAPVETPAAAATPGAEAPVPAPAEAASGDHLTPGVDEAPSHRRAARRTTAARPATAERPRRQRPARRTTARKGDGFGPPSTAEVGDPAPSRPVRPAELPPVPDPRPGEAAVAAWTGTATPRESVPARRAGRATPGETDPDRTQRRPVRPRRRPGWPMSNEPAGPAASAPTPDAPFGPGTGSRPAGRGRGDSGAAPR